MGKQLVMGIDVGGQSTKLGIVDKDGTILCGKVISSLQDKLDDYIRHRFLEESQRNADNIITERTWIGQPHGRPTNKNAKWKRIQ